jgi:hypothetical protein
MPEPLALLLLPGRLERFKQAAHARELLAIPRVVALEARSARGPGILTEAAALRQARRLRLPGEPRLVVLYHPRQYPLGRAICARHHPAELWYVHQEDPGPLADFDELARERAVRVIHTGEPEDTDALRRRLLELEVINPRPFYPGGRISDR